MGKTKGEILNDLFVRGLDDEDAERFEEFKRKEEEYIKECLHKAAFSQQIFPPDKVAPIKSCVEFCDLPVFTINEETREQTEKELLHYHFDPEPIELPVPDDLLELITKGHKTDSSKFWQVGVRGHLLRKLSWLIGWFGRLDLWGKLRDRVGWSKRGKRWD